VNTCLTGSRSSDPIANPKLLIVVVPHPNFDNPSGYHGRPVVPSDRPFVILDYSIPMFEQRRIEAMILKHVYDSHFQTFVDRQSLTGSRQPLQMAA
jgi:hypothetical protein